jgi:peptidoglycan/LPS O-acetylase OafA/YrhL
MSASLITPKPAQRETRETKHIPELDGIRGIAILVVLVSHFGSTAGGDTVKLGRFLNEAFGLGWAGVDLFFVLSGFLITGILLDSKGSGRYFSNFYARRTLRIFPLYFLYVFVFFHVAMPVGRLLGHGEYIDTSGEIWYWLYLANWWNGLGHSIKYLIHFWSLCIEEQFYFTWPLIVLLASRKTLKAICLTFIVLSPVLRCIFTTSGSEPPVFLYNFTPFRMEPIALGALIAILVREDGTSIMVARTMKYLWIPVLLIFTAISIHSGTTGLAAVPVSRFGYTCVDLTFASFVYFVAQSVRRNRKVGFLRNRALRSCGKYSYGMYVLHMPIVIFLSVPLAYLFSRTHLDPPIARVVVAIAVGTGLTYVAALISWNVLENPFLQLKKRFPVAGRAPQPIESAPQ